MAKRRIQNDKIAHIQFLEARFAPVCVTGPRNGNLVANMEIGNFETRDYKNFFIAIL